MNLRLRPYGLSGCLAVLVLAACSNGTETVASKYVASALIGPEGGTVSVTTADDATLAGTNIVIPAGALKASTTISIGLVGDGESVAQTKLGQVAAGPVIDFEPSGTKFLLPVTITIPSTAPSSTSAAALHVEAVESDGSVRELDVTSFTSGLVTFNASGFTNFGAISGGPSSGTCSTDADCPSGEACVGPNSEFDFTHCAATSTTCASGESDCSGTCADLTSDSNNCGACGSVCPTGATCGDGVCAGTTVTPDASVACSSDADCGSGEACVAGECVGEETDGCAPTTCATLGLTCGTASDGCGGTLSCGTCSDDGGTDAASDATVCAGGQTDCSGVCADLTSDPNNCGACGAECATGETCSAGACTG